MAPTADHPANSNLPTDADLLRDYAQSHSQTAFARLVERHVNLVYAAARRQLPADAHLADDVTQAVFILLAQKARAGRIPARAVLAGWLHTTTRYVAANARRAAATRRSHEQKAAQMSPEIRPDDATSSDNAADWNAIAPHLDAALGRLAATDRDAVLLKYFQNKTHHDVGAALGLSEEAARKRISRALDRLRELLVHRGIALPATARLSSPKSATLATLLTAHATEAAPASVSVAAAAGFAPSAAMAATALAQSTLTTLTWIKVKIAAAILVTASILTTTGIVTLHKLTADARQPAPAKVTPTLVLAPAAAKTATFTGRVLTPAGQPAPAARVILCFPSDDPETDPVTHATRTAADGAFTFRDVPLPPASRSPALFATAPGYALAQSQAFSDEENELTLSPATTLRVTALDPAGKPVPGLRLAPVAMFPRGPGVTSVPELPPEIARELARQTDATGVAPFDALPARSTVRLDTDDPRFARLTYNDSVDTGDAPASPPATLRLRPGGTISGVVTYGLTGKPAPGIAVGAQALSRSDSRTNGWGHAVTNDRGEYRMGRVAPGDYNVFLSSNSPDFRRDWTAAAIPDVHLQPGQHLAGQNLTLVKGILITGHITRADSGDPTPHLTIGLYGPAHPRSSAMIDIAQADDSGAYTLRTLPGPNYVYVHAIPPDGYQRPKPQELNIADNAAPPTIDFALPRKPGRPVAGRVLDVDGKPVPDARVSAEDPRGDMYALTVQTTDERGNFYFKAVAPGTLLRAHRGTRETPDATPVNGNEPEVVLRLEKRLRVTLTGTVTDADGNPIANAKVQVLRQEGQFGTGMGKPEVTDAQGRYRIAGLSPSARYGVYAESPGFGTAGAKLTLDPAKPTLEADPLRFPVSSRPISGTVVDGDNHPVANTTVELDGPEPGHQSTTTDSQGHFTFHIIAGARAQVFTRDPTGHAYHPTDARAGDKDLLLKTHP